MTAVKPEIATTPVDSSAKDSAKDRTPLSHDIDFCAKCGSVFKEWSIRQAMMKCHRCGHVNNLTHLLRVKVVTTRTFNSPIGKATKQVESSQPTVDRRCSKCANDGMLFATRQTRAADEGQTVYYTCRKCGFKEIEHS